VEEVEEGERKKREGDKKRERREIRTGDDIRGNMT
jgi:hypothetical protein